MKWIDVNDELPLTGVRVLASLLSSNGPVIRDASFSPSKGWMYWLSDIAIDQVFHWHHLFEAPPEKKAVIQPTSGECQAACETQDDIQESHLSCDPEDS
jgi:hypothetical protein